MTPAILPFVIVAAVFLKPKTSCGFANVNTYALKPYRGFGLFYRQSKFVEFRTNRCGERQADFHFNISFIRLNIATSPQHLKLLPAF